MMECDKNAESTECTASCRDCANYVAMVEDAEQAYKRLDLIRFSYKLRLHKLQEQSLANALPVPSEFCCRLKREEVIETNLNLYMMICEVEAYKMMLMRKDPTILKERRLDALEAFKIHRARQD